MFLNWITKRRGKKKKGIQLQEEKAHRLHLVQQAPKIASELCQASNATRFTRSLTWSCVFHSTLR